MPQKRDCRECQLKEGMGLKPAADLDVTVYRCGCGAMLIVADAKRPDLDRWYPGR